GVASDQPPASAVPRPDSPCYRRTTVPRGALRPPLHRGGDCRACLPSRRRLRGVRMSDAEEIPDQALGLLHLLPGALQDVIRAAWGVALTPACRIGEANRTSPEQASAARSRG